MTKLSMRRLGIIAFTAVSTLGAATTALASQAGWFTTQKPGVACRTQNANMQGIYSYIMNFDANAQQAWCPLESDYADLGPSDVGVVVNGGWANSQSCTVWEMQNPFSGWAYSTAGIEHDSGNNLDNIAFHLPGNYGVGTEVECSVPPQGRLLRYSGRTYQFYDYTSW